jgi:predicted ester cyclase
MTTESNKALMQRFTQFINTASEELAGELISPGAIFHVPGRAEPMRGPAGYLAIIGMMRGGFPDIQWTLEETIAEATRLLHDSLGAARMKVPSMAFHPLERKSR